MAGKQLDPRVLILLTCGVIAALGGCGAAAQAWTEFITLELRAGSATLSCSILAWLLSIPLSDVSVVDIYWPLGFLVQGLTITAFQPTLIWRQRVFLALLVLWSLRLASYLAWRKVKEHGVEDPRYNDYVLIFKRGRDPNWLVVLGSLFQPFIFQGWLMVVLGTPVVLVMGWQGGPAIGILDAIAVLVWCVGFVFEAGGDLQLMRFKAEPTNKGKVLDTDLFALTRHPNYFGDFMVWLGYWLLALGHSPAVAIYLIGSPIVTFILLRYVSGAQLLDQEMAERKPQYKEYVSSTSVFFPCPRRKNA